MLPNHAPLVVAEQFGTLESLHPGRIDLGLGRAPGTDQRTALALRRTVEGLSAEDFPNELADLIAMLAGDPSRACGRCPRRRSRRRSGCSAPAASAPSWPACSDCRSPSPTISPARTPRPALELYRSSFRPSQWLDAPHAMIAVNVICADTDAEAEYLAKPGLLSFLRLRAGQPIALPTPEEAAGYEFSGPSWHSSNNARSVRDWVHQRPFRRS